MKILVVDDEPLVRRSLARVAGSRAHTVLEAADGEEGLKIWRSENPDLVFLDVLMPGLTGPQVLKEIQPSSAKVILISAYTGEYNVDTAKNLGADLFIPKPFQDIFKVIEIAERLFADGVQK